MWRQLCLTILLISCSVSPATAEPLSDAELRAQFVRPDLIPFPADNAYTAEREILGRTLFFDPRLSGSNLLSCASCHNPSFGWGDGQALGRGAAMRHLPRRSPTILNAAWGSAFFWDGRAPTLEAQVPTPIASPTEMDMRLAELPDKLAAIAGYRPLFTAAYGDQPIALPTIVKAIATFERGIVSSRSAFDRWVEGDERALTPAERRGLDVFMGPAHCAACHSGWNLSDGSFRDIGLPSSDIGRAALEPDDPLALHAFKTPGLSDTVRRAPYMHDGSLPTLESVVAFYESGSQPRPSRSPLIETLHLTDQERVELVAFLHTLTAPPQEFAAPALPR